MHMFAVALLATTALSDGTFIEPSEDAMRQAFASDLADGVKGVLAYMAETGGTHVLARIRAARTDEYEIRAFRKVECRPDNMSPGQISPGHVCAFQVEVETIVGPIERSLGGRFFIGPCGLAYDHDA
jgi:hypothetical protein